MNMKRWERESLTPEEIDLVLDAARDEEEKAMMTTLADTGMRVNELLRLRKDWVHFPRRKRGITGLLKRSESHGFIKIPVNEDYTPVAGTKGRGPKTKRIRNVPMTARLHDVLKEWLKDHNGFFRTYNHVYNVCVRSGKKAGIEPPVGYRHRGASHIDPLGGVYHSKGFHVTPHIFRHSFITWVYYASGLRPEEIAVLVGHRDAKMVNEVYLHLDEKEITRKIEESGCLER